MTIKMILAVDESGAIGWTDGRLPWKLPADMKRFKELTTGGEVVMGFNTFKSLNRPGGLPNRKNFVLTRRPWSEVRGHFDHESDISIIADLGYIERHVKYRSQGAVRDHAMWIIGGASVYDEALSKQMVDEIYLTVVHTDSGGDVRMQHDLVSWKHFVLTQRQLGTNWKVEEQSRQWDGDIETTYLHFTRT